ncbi:GNAT family N-acetyltransferase [Plantactinospora endophytica]|uniref:N-acetyltransferase n=1 Tax=Plantactinospora endophytica TaxID=673535 RepID=A0ABQ4E896_9ACTN|nr:GNAT family N-acetyltransferase [Plantactinospora endophytica]GIG90955.1 N-acetyltransferase [Plantactinospora endophytica]
MLITTRDDGYELCTDPGRVDVDRVHHWLCTDAYWALGRPRDVLVRAIEGSTVYGVYAPDDGRQVAFARVVTDGATFGWLCDVYVDRAERGRGLARWLVRTVRDEYARRGVKRILLATGDAHGVYAAEGFTPLAEPSQWMEADLRKPPVTPLTGKESDPVSPLTVEP